MPTTSPRHRYAKRTFAPSEVAWVTCTSVKSVNLLVDRREVRPVRGATGRGESPRALELSGLLYVGLRKALSTTLSAAGKKYLYTALVELEPEVGERLDAPDSNIDDLSIPIEGGAVRIVVGDIFRPVFDRLHALSEATDVVTSDPEVRGGEPVVRGTRVPVYMLADLTEQGATEDEILEDYPSLSRELLRAALVYAEIHPRKGRPKTASWRSRRRSKR